MLTTILQNAKMQPRSQFWAAKGKTNSRPIGRFLPRKIAIRKGAPRELWANLGNQGLLDTSEDAKASLTSARGLSFPLFFSTHSQFSNLWKLGVECTSFMEQSQMAANVKFDKQIELKLSKVPKQMGNENETCHSFLTALLHGQVGKKNQLVVCA